MRLRMEAGGAMVGSGEALLVPLLQVGDLHPAGEAGKEFFERFGIRLSCPAISTNNE